MNAALIQLGFPTHPTDSFRYFIGSGVDYLANCVLPKDNLDGSTITKCMAVYRDEYRKHFADNTKPYPGIPELLSNLAERNIPQVILSNKPDEFTQIIVEKLLPRWSFQIVRGVVPSVPPKPDPTAALQIASELKIPPRRFLYLGDTNTDMQTANSAGMYAAGALWGFRTAEELRENGAKTLVESPQDVLRLLD